MYDQEQNGFMKGKNLLVIFCNLENRNYTSKIMNKLYSKNGSLLTDQKDILTETANHYKDLYSQKDTDSVDLRAIINNDNFT